MFCVHAPLGEKIVGLVPCRRLVSLRFVRGYLLVGEPEETTVEHADVVVVGGRLAGCAVAAPLARAGRKVVVLDKMSFPSDQLSTHLLMPAGTSELSRMGALPRILELNPSRVRWTTLVAEGITCTERLRAASDGIDFGVCVPRDLQDVCLVEAVREQGVSSTHGARSGLRKWHGLDRVWST